MAATLTFAASCGAPSKKAASSTDALTRNDAKIAQIISQMTLDEKIAMVHAKTIMSSEGVPRLGVAPLHYADGPFGVREEVGDGFRPLGWPLDSATYFPTGSALAATWDPELAYKYGEGIGKEARLRGKDIMLGPAINIQRLPVGGRSYEYLSEDPVLTGALAVGYIRGMQDAGTAVCVKHFALNNQETNRGSVDVIIDERTMREVYLRPFEDAVKKGGSYTIMPAYNRINGVFCSENDALLNGILRGEWGFKGATVSDWGGTRSTVGCALGGLDVQMPGDNYYGQALKDSVEAGVVPMAVLDSMVMHLLRVRFAIEAVPENVANTKVASTPEGRDAAYKVARKSIVLLKNTDAALPLSKGKVKKIAVIGANAAEKTALGGIGAGVKSPYEITPLDGILAYVGDACEVVYAPGHNVESRVSWDSSHKEKKDDALLTAEALQVAKGADVVIFVAGTGKWVESEGFDRDDIFLPGGQDDLIEKVAGVNPNIITVVISGGVVDLRRVEKQSKAIVQGWWNGLEGGKALAEVLFGEYSPSGKLPFSWPLKLEDSPAYAMGNFPQMQEEGDIFTSQYRKDVEEKDSKKKDYGEAGPPVDGHPIARYTEGPLVGYRWFDTKDAPVMYPFGHGLSYSSFEYSNLSVKSENGGLKVSFDILNTGDCDADEVAQVYIARKGGAAEYPAKELKAFSRISVPKGGKKTVTLEIPSREFSFWDTATHSWKADRTGEVKVLVGSSSRDIRLDALMKASDIDLR